MENIKLQFCGNAKPVKSEKGDFWGININKEQLAEIITKLQTNNPYIELCIGEHKEHKEGEISHYVYSHPKYQSGELREHIATIRLYKSDLEKLPKDDYRNISVTMVEHLPENRNKDGQPYESDYSLYVNVKDDRTYSVGAGFKPQEKVELILCGNLNGRENEKGKYYSASFDKATLNKLSETVFKNKDYIDVSVAENKQHKEGEINSHYVYSNLKYQDATDRNIHRIMDLRLYKKDLDKIPKNDEYDRIFAFVSENKNKEDKQLASDYSVVVKPDKDKDESFLIGVGYKKNELKIGTPVHFQCKNAVLEAATKSEIQAAFGVIAGMDGSNFVIESPAGQYVLAKDRLKPASREDLENFKNQFEDLKLSFNKSLADKVKTTKDVLAPAKTAEEIAEDSRRKAVREKYGTPELQSTQLKK